MPVAEQLAQELETFERNRERLLGEALGKYVLIRGDEIVAAYDTEGDAINEGYRRFGNVPFFVRVVSAVDQPANFLSPVMRQDWS
jgi:hypothetical protein